MDQRQLVNGSQQATVSRALRRAAGLAVAVLTTGACYSYAPLASAPSPGARVSLQVNDVGRVALGRQVGPGVSSLEGTVRSVADSGYLLDVKSVSYISGQTNDWNGEQLLVSPQYVAIARQRQFSKERTALVAAAGIGGLVAFIASRGLSVGGGTDQKEPPPPPPSGQ